MLSVATGAALPRSVFTPEYAYFAARVVELRKTAGLTQAELALRLGRPQSYVSKYERGERRLDVVEFLAVARILGTDAAGFMAELEQMHDKQTPLRVSATRVSNRVKPRGRGKDPSRERS